MNFRRWGEAAYMSIQSPKNHPSFDQFSYFTTLCVCAITILPSTFDVDHHHHFCVQLLVLIINRTSIFRTQEYCSTAEEDFTT